MDSNTHLKSRGTLPLSDLKPFHLLQLFLDVFLGQMFDKSKAVRLTVKIVRSIMYKKVDPGSRPGLKDHGCFHESPAPFPISTFYT